MDEKQTSCSQVLFQQSDADYAMALRLFTLERKTPQKIFRIQNPTLYVQYQLEKSNGEAIRRQAAHKWPLNDVCITAPKRLSCRISAPKDSIEVTAEKMRFVTDAARTSLGDMSYSADDKYSKPKPETNEKYGRLMFLNE